MVGNIVGGGLKRELLGSISVTSINWGTDAYTPSGYKQSQEISFSSTSLINAVKDSNLVYITFKFVYKNGASCAYCPPVLVDVKEATSAPTSGVAHDYRTRIDITNSSGTIKYGTWSIWLWMNYSAEPHIGGRMYVLEDYTEQVAAVEASIYKLA